MNMLRGIEPNCPLSEENIARDSDARQTAA
jgi:hypothetical protein